jgi:hypothetical protein
MEGLFLYGLGVVTGMAALPWFQRLADRARRTLAELELADPPAPPAATDDKRDGSDDHTTQPVRPPRTTSPKPRYDVGTRVDPGHRLKLARRRGQPIGRREMTAATYPITRRTCPTSRPQSP